MARLVYASSRFVAILLATIASATALQAQVPTPRQSQETVADETPYVLHIDAREVVIDVIAVDAHDRSVTNLAAGDVQVNERLGKSAEIPESVHSFRLIDPDGSAPGDLPESGFRIAANESCLQRQSIHYQLVYNPGQQALTQGYHEVHITTARRGVHLFYRHSYYIGATVPVASAVSQTEAQINHDLELDACSHPLVPLSISLRAVRISTGSKETARFKLTIENDSLAFVSFSNNGRGLQLDYGACNFNAAGKPIGYVTATADQVLTPVEFARAEAHGLQRILEFAPPVRDCPGRAQAAG